MNELFTSLVQFLASFASSPISKLFVSRSNADKSWSRTNIETVAIHNVVRTIHAVSWRSIWKVIPAQTVQLWRIKPT